MFTRNSKAAARVAEQFEKRQVSKTYWALLEKRPENDSGLLVDWLLKVPDQAISEVVSEGTAKAKEARLEYRVLREFKGRWLVEVLLLTGRMHQIRVQFASRGCPVVGDTKYGGSEWLGAGSMIGETAPAEIPAPAEVLASAEIPVVVPDEATVPDETVSAESGSASNAAMALVRQPASDIRIALHARSLSLLHPIRYDKLTLETPVPAWWDLSDESFYAKLRS